MRREGRQWSFEELLSFTSWVKENGPQGKKDHEQPGSKKKTRQWVLQKPGKKREFVGVGRGLGTGGSKSVQEP